jgi:hypothetical protein
MALQLIQPLKEMSTRNIWFIGLTTLPLLCAECHEIWQPQPPGALRACPSLITNGFTFHKNDITRTTTKTQN